MKVPTCRFGIIGFVASPGAFDNCHFLRGLESRTCCKMCKSSNQPGSRVAQQNSAIDLGPIGPSHKMVVTAKHGTASNPYRIRYRYRWVLKSSKISPNSSWNFSPCMNKGTLKSSFTSLQEPPPGPGPGHPASSSAPTSSAWVDTSTAERHVSHGHPPWESRNLGMTWTCFYCMSTYIIRRTVVIITV